MGTTSERNAGPPSSRRGGGGRPARVVLVTGDGGVGKTTVAAALALEAGARDGGSVLVEFGDGESGARLLGKTHKSVEHIALPSHDAVVRAFGPLFGPAIIGRAVLSNFAIRHFIGAAPAVRELATLECVRLIAEEHPRQQVVVDLPATGHGVAWLKTPSHFSALVDSGPLHDLTHRLVTDLVSKGKCSI